MQIVGKFGGWHLNASWHKAGGNVISSSNSQHQGLVTLEAKQTNSREKKSLRHTGVGGGWDGGLPR